MRDSDRYLPPRVLQIIGILLLVAFAGFWFLTGRSSSLLVAAALTLILLGGYRGAGQALEKLTARDREQ